GAATERRRREHVGPKANVGIPNQGVPYFVSQCAYRAIANDAHQKLGDASLLSEAKIPAFSLERLASAQPNGSCLSVYFAARCWGCICAPGCQSITLVMN
ncbi:hypothetical protein, partial [Caballeronia terrestris]|uniref:hypothetical protein n=1 Tax=Caballeronia terrestris TaxID=1226301 RepID=UPI001F3A28FD